LRGEYLEICGGKKQKLTLMRRRTLTQQNHIKYQDITYPITIIFKTIIFGNENIAT